MSRLANKIALITGAASGIGRATAELFHQEGATVIVSDIDDDAGLTLATALKERSEYFHLDVSQETDWMKATQHIQQKYNGLDILINNAGIGGYRHTKGPHTPEDFDLESWRIVHAVNSDGTALGCKHAIPLMKIKNSGSIVNISSRSGIVGMPNLSAYAASKAAIRNHTKSVALYCAEKKYGIRCNSIHPGAILTPIWDPMFGEGAKREQMIANISAAIPLGHMGRAIDVAYAALYLASDESVYVTGTELNIDGGLLAGTAASLPKPNS